MLTDISTQLSRLDPLSLAGVLLISGLFFLLTLPRRSSIPMVNEKSLSQFRSSHVQRRFLQDARNLIKAGFRKVLPACSPASFGSTRTISSRPCLQYSNEIRAHPVLSFGRAITLEFHSDIHGFEPFNQLAGSDEIFQDAIRMKLAQNLGSVTKPLSDETSIVLEKHWSNDANWHEVALKPTNLKMVAQLLSKVFLGDKICRNPDWLRITVDYTVNTFLAAEDLRLWPRLIRPNMANFLPSCRKIRRELKEATKIITPVLLGLCAHAEVIQPLREKIVTVIQEEGWKKPALYKLKLMDSVLKESQRMKPVNITSMRRLALKDIKLSDGTLIPKGSSLLVSSHKMWDPDVYPNPETFDPYRFMRLRETPGHETSAQLVSPSPEHLGFGYGKHACPGRFYAANEVKIALCHILLKYDFKLPDGYTPTVRTRGISVSADPSAKLVIRRRQDEIAL
ncbi:aldehyde reductase 1 [Aspergillus lentulus]|nr:aldehyde reductase 1 [Aspergillus lentulus]